jgi:hypothetical protein
MPLFTVVKIPFPMIGSVGASSALWNLLHITYMSAATRMAFTETNSAVNAPHATGVCLNLNSRIE